MRKFGGLSEFVFERRANFVDKGNWGWIWAQLKIPDGPLDYILMGFKGIQIGPQGNWAYFTTIWVKGNRIGPCQISLGYWIKGVWA